ncbi:MAG: PIN domain-containing protein [Caldilineaceae bacterium]
MPVQPSRIFLDTNVYIIGAVDAKSAEARILHWLGFRQHRPDAPEVIVSEELLNQIRRVARRLKDKAWGGQILARIWQNFQIQYVLVDPDEIEQLAVSNTIPKEDVGVYLTARNGQADCFVSANHKLIRALIQRTGEFECLTPTEFVASYINGTGN